MFGRISILLVIAVAVTACSEAPDTDDTKAVDQQPEVRIQVSGDQSTSFESNGSLFCGESNMGGQPYYFELYAMQPPYQFNMRFPRSMTPGAYSIYGADDPESNNESDENAYFYWRGENRERFDQVEQGQLILESIPAAQGERLVGTIEADLTNDEGSRVSLEADLDLDAGRQSFDECP